MLNINIKTINDTISEARMTAMDEECSEKELRNMCWRLSLLLANVTGTLVGMDNVIGNVMDYCAKDVMSMEHMSREGYRDDN